MKQYRHKKLLWIAKDVWWYYQVINEWENIKNWFWKFISCPWSIPKEAVENSKDWEEMVEKDWKEELYDSLDWLFWKGLDKEESYPIFIERLKRYTPPNLSNGESIPKG